MLMLAEKTETGRRLLCALGHAIAEAVRKQRESGRGAEFSVATGQSRADTIFQVDRFGEEALISWFEKNWPADWPVELVVEGIDDEERRFFPWGCEPGQVETVCIIDPIDGTRPLMHDKRSAWSLAALARRRRDGPTRLDDIVVAAMTEIPVAKQTLRDQVSGVRGAGPEGLIADRFGGGERAALRLRPSGATDFRYGYASFARFFPEAKAFLAEMEEELWWRLYGLGARSPLVFDDQYISTGGQLYGLLSGTDRMIADLRPLAYARLGYDASLACHPYDICTAMLLEEAGGIVESPDGSPLTSPLDTVSPVSWVGYANENLARQVRPILREIIERYCG